MSDSTVPRPALPAPPVSLQTRMVLLSYFAYFFYYFTRKHLGVATNALVDDGFSDITIGWIQTAYGICYAAGQFLSGAAGDRLGPRIAITAGMILSGVASIAFGIFPFIGVLAVGFSLNGIFQSTGWPGACKIISEWIHSRHRGRVMGFWMTCYIFGSLLANILAGYLLERYGWREVFLVTGIIVAVVGIIQGIALINRPEDRGYSLGESLTRPGSPTGARGWLLMIRQPAILLLGFSYMGLKFIRYTFFAWCPYYLSQHVGLKQDSSAYVSNGFEIGGIIGLCLGGWLADRHFRDNRTRLALAALVGMTATLLAFRVFSAHGGIWTNSAGLAAIGLFLYIADSIISGTAAQDIAGTENTASAAGIINGIGSIAQLFAGILPIWLKDQWGWDAVFLAFIGLTVISILCLLPVALPRRIARAG